jgi:hypothetical protein
MFPLHKELKNLHKLLLTRVEILFLIFLDRLLSKLEHLSRHSVK